MQPHCNCQQSPWRRTLAPVPHASNLAQCCRLMRGRWALIMHARTHTHMQHPQHSNSHIHPSIKKKKKYTRARIHRAERQKERAKQRGRKEGKKSNDCLHVNTNPQVINIIRGHGTLYLSVTSGRPLQPYPYTAYPFPSSSSSTCHPLCPFALDFLFSQSADIVLYPKFLTPLCVSYMCRTCVTYLSNMCDSSCISFNDFLLTTSKFCLSHSRTLICFHSSCLSACLSPITLSSL